MSLYARNRLLFHPHVWSLSPEKDLLFAINPEFLDIDNTRVLFTSKMERFSNDYDELRKVAREEVSLFVTKAGESIIASYGVYPSIAGFPFKISLIQNEKGDIRSGFRQWDTAYNFARWKTGIYNLDRLRIISDEYSLVDLEKKKMDDIFSQLKAMELPKSLNNDSAIVLDGVPRELKIETYGIDVSYTWNAGTNDVEIFIPLLELMEGFHADAIKRN